MAEFIGAPIEAEVLTQLEKRREIYKKAGKVGPEIKLSEIARTDKEFQYLYSRNAWVRVISSVDIPKNLAKTTVEYDSSLAKKYVLSNLSYLDEKDSLKSQAGLDFQGRIDSSKAYAFSNSVGTRPRPGINSFTVISKGRFGTIKEANIGFNVWSPEDLEDIEKLYFRPGFSCIIQFGHSLYVNNQGKITTPTGINALGIYFEDKPLEGEPSIFQNLSNTRKNSDYNLENFVGFIKNFSWSFRPDGGYDCSLSVISQGEVLDSISMKIGLPEDAYDEKAENIKNNENIVRRFLADLRNSKGFTIREETFGLVSSDYLSSYFKNFFNKPELSIPETDDLLIIGNKRIGGLQSQVSLEKKRWIAVKKGCGVDLGSGKTEIIYFPLRNLIYVINNHYFPKNKYGSNIIEIDSKSEQPYFSFKQHVSLDPAVCLLPKKIELYRVGDSVRPVSLVPTYFKQITRLQKDYSEPSKDKSGSRILDILITDLLVEQALDNAGDTIQNFINYILESITKALGGLNEFMLVPVENSLKMELYDQAVTPNRNNFTNIIGSEKLDLTGVGSLFTDLKIETKISKNLVSMISIAAQGVVDSGEDYGGMLSYNKGYKDRFVGSNNTILKCDYEDNGTVLSPFHKLLVRSATTLIPIITIALLYNKFLKDRQKREEAKKETDILTYGKFGLALLNSYETLFPYNYRSYSSGGGTYNSALFSLLQEEGLPYFKNFYINDQLGNITEETIKEKTNIGKGLIPVELSFTMDGIGGLRLGQAFQVKPGVLPSYYNDTGFIITGVENTIQNNRWYTTVKAQTFLLHVENNQGDAEYKTYNLYGTQDKSKQSTTENTSTAQTAQTSQQRSSTELVGQGAKFVQARYVASRYLYGLGSRTTISDKEWDLLLRATAGETSGAVRESAAIVSVILNRTKNSFRGKNTITATLNDDRQFEAVTGDIPNPEFNNPTPSRLNAIATDIVNNLSSFESKKWLNFTSNNLKSYKGNTTFYYIGLDTPGREIIGGTIFFTASNR